MFSLPRVLQSPFRLYIVPLHYHLLFSTSVKSIFSFQKPIFRTMTTEIPKGFKTITEGQATIIFPENNDVFYNPVQVLNRDLSILNINVYGETLKKEQEELKQLKPKRYENLRLKNKEYWEKKSMDTAHQSMSIEDPIMSEDGLYILEALSASGLRSIRYYKEIQGVKRIITNDIADAAVQSIKRNIEFNKIDPQRMVANQADATLYMYENRSKENQFDVIDLDPYGSCSIFIDSAVQAIKDGGLMLVTCTDLAVLCGNHPEVCFSKYGANCPKTPFCHELALRIALGYINNVAAKYGRYIDVLCAFQIDFYIRMFIRVYDSKQEVKKTACKSSLLYSCSCCDNFYFQPLGKCVDNKKYLANSNHTPLNCPECGSSWVICGPVYNGPLYKPEWINTLIERVKKTEKSVIPTYDRLLGLLYAVYNEQSELCDCPLFYSLHSFCNTLHITSPKMIEIQAALIHDGYQVSQSHTDPLAIKTNAPSSVVFDIFRAWNKAHPHTTSKNYENTPAFKIFSKPPTKEYDFTFEDITIKEFEVARYPENPEANWGPKSRATMKRTNFEEKENKKMASN